MPKVASFDEDFDYERAARAKTSRKPKATPSRKGKTNRRRWSFDMGRVARYGAIGMSAAVTLGIMYNALLGQKGHHPAPLFAQAPPSIHTTSRHAAPAAAKAPATTTRDRSDDAEGATPPLPIARQQHGGAAHDTGDQTTGDDPIARLLRTGTVASGGERSGSKRVIAVQKALTKLGFAVRASGSMGPSTRKAIERFEKDRHLPVKGELTHRLVRMLSAEAGMKLD